LRIERSHFPPDFDAFEVLPNLKELRSTRALCLRIPFPWKQITTLCTYSTATSSVLQELALATEATEVKLYNCDSQGMVSADSHLIHRLRSLSIIIDSATSKVSPWFQWLTLPRLDQLSIAGSTKDPPSSCDHPFLGDCFRSFLSRSSCSITSLILVNLPLWDADALALLSALPSLSSLTISERESSPFKNYILTTHFFESLTIDHDNTFSNRRSPELQLKALRSLDLRLHATVPAKVIVQFLESRWTNDVEYSAVLGVEDLSNVKVLVLQSLYATELDEQKLCGLLKMKEIGVHLSCSTKYLKAKGS
jgi:hypothetical protein